MYKLLIVDDEKMIRNGLALGITWSEVGIDEVYTAASATEALKMIEVHAPQIMLSDISMTELSGIDLIGKVRETDKDMRIIVLTGYDYFEYARDCLKMGVQDYLLKPIDDVALLKLVKKQVEELEQIRIEEEEAFLKTRSEGTKAQMAIEAYMREIVHHGDHAHNEANDVEFRDIATFAMDIKKDVPMCVGILIAQMHNNLDPFDQHYRLLTMRLLCIQIVDSRGLGITFTDDDGSLIIAFYAENGDITAHTRELEHILEDEYDIRPRIVLGSVVPELKMLSISYNDAVINRSNVGQLVQKQDEPFDLRVDTHNKFRGFDDNYQAYKRQMLVDVADGDAVFATFEQIANLFDNYNLSTDFVQLCCFDVVSDLYFQFVKSSHINPDDSLNRFMNGIIGSNMSDAIFATQAYITNLYAAEKGDRHEAIAKAKKYIIDNIEQDISVASIADSLYLSPNYFCRLFKKQTGEGCNEYICRKRIERAKYLLETTMIKSGTIASMVGYNDTNYFSMAFKKHTGSSPSAYRKQAQDALV
ncbi:MAG: response regulator [Clostridiales Family XIII bacterium]|jgi:two-component system response regulator YesN|nr:response regulator [Clostridiales Family XIII bacterium]